MVWSGPSNPIRLYALVGGAPILWKMALDCLSGKDTFSVFVRLVTSLKPNTKPDSQLCDKLQVIVTVREGFFSPLSKWWGHRYLSYPSRLLFSMWKKPLPHPISDVLCFLCCPHLAWCNIWIAMSHFEQMPIMVKFTLAERDLWDPLLQLLWPCSRVTASSVSLATESCAPQGRWGLCRGKERYWLEVRFGNP